MVDERTRNRRAWLLFGLAILTLVLILCTCRDSRMIESRLLERGQNELAAAGFDPELVQVSGRDLSLTGTVPSQDAKLAAGALVTALPGVRLFSNNLSVTEEASAAALPGEANLLLELGASPALSGVVDEATATLAADTVTPLAQDTDLDNSLDVQSEDTAPDWFAGVIELAPAYAQQVEDGSLELTPDSLRLEGEVESDAVRSELGETLGAAADDSVALQNNLRVVGSQSPTELNFTLDETPAGLDLSGEVNEAAATALSTALTPLDVDNSLNVSDDVSAPEWLGGVVELAPDFVDNVDRANLSVTPDSVTLTGTALSEAERSAQVEAFSAAAGDAQVTDNLQILDAQAPSLSFVETGEDITLSGNLPPSASDSAAATASELSGEVNTNLASAEDIAAPDWLDGVVSFLPQFSDEVEEARLELNNNSLTLAGDVASEEERETLEAALRERVGEELSIANELNVTQADQTQADQTQADQTQTEQDPPANFRLETSEAGTRLSGTLPEASETALVDSLTPFGEIRNDLETADVSTPPWLNGLIEGLPSYTEETQDAALELEGNTLTLSGNVESDAKKEGLGERIRELSGGEAEIINNLSVEAPADVEADAEITDTETADPETADPETATETPEAEQDAAEDVEAAADEAIVGEAEAVTDEAIVEEPVAEEPVAEDSVVEDPVAETETRPDTEAPAEPEEVEPTSEEPVADETEEAEPATAEVEPTELPEPTEVVSAPNLRIDVRNDSVSLSGVVPSDALKNEAAQGYDKTVDNGLELGNVEPADVVAPVLAFGPEFAAAASRASLVLADDTLTLQGVVADEASRNALLESANAAVGASLTVVDRLSLAASIPTNEDGK